MARQRMTNTQIMAASGSPILASPRHGLDPRATMPPPTPTHTQIRIQAVAFLFSFLFFFFWCHHDRRSPFATRNGPLESNKTKRKKKKSKRLAPTDSCRMTSLGAAGRRRGSKSHLSSVGRSCAGAWRPRPPSRTTPAAGLPRPTPAGTELPQHTHTTPSRSNDAVPASRGMSDDPPLW